MSEEEYQQYIAVYSNKTDIPVSPSGFVSKENQAGNQDHIKGTTPTGPLNQASTPLNTGLKLIPQQRNSKNKINEERKQPSMILSLSVREDIKLHESDNAWRPARLIKGENATDDDKMTEELYKKVRGVLHKWTPQKFETLLFQIKGLQIDTQSRLQGVIDLVFKKAVEEPDFSVACALMCSELALMQVPMPSSTPEKPEVVNFRKLLINRCQVEFEKQSHNDSVRLDKVKEIEECIDPEKKKDLQFELEEYDKKLRMKSVGNIRFIGELFKQNMVTINIIMKCLKNLLDKKDKESLECLCTLLTTTGKELESKNVDLSYIFTNMKNIADKKDGNVSSRIRFMLHDVIDLKNSKWVPRRQDHNPKTIDQIQKEAEQEQYNINVMHSGPPPLRRNDRGGNVGSGQNTLNRKGNRGNRNNSSDPDGWQTSYRQSATPFNIWSDKLKNKATLIDEPLGKSSMFASWSKGTLEKAQSQQLQPSKGQTPGIKESCSSKGPGMERSYSKYDGRGSTSGSQAKSLGPNKDGIFDAFQKMENECQTCGQRPDNKESSNLNDSSSSSYERSTPAPVLLVSASPVSATTQQTAAPTEPALTEKQMENWIANCLDEFVNGNCTVDEFYIDISPVIPVSFYPKMVNFLCSHVQKKSLHIRTKTAHLIEKLVKQGNVSLDDQCSSGLEGISSD